MQTQKLVLFTPEYCRELSPSNRDNTPEASLINGYPRHYSTIGITPIRVGHSPGDHVRLLDSRATLYIADGFVNVIEGTDIYLNGKNLPLGQHAINHGDSLWAGTTNIVVHDGYITCFGSEYSSGLNISTTTPEKYEEFPIYKRSPRIIKREPTETIELTAPEKKEEMKKGELVKLILPPLAMVTVTVAMGILMGRGIFVLMSASAMSISLVFSITNFFGDRKKRKAKEKSRLENYENYLLEQRQKIHALHMEYLDALQYHNLSPAEIEQEVTNYSPRLFERAANDGDFITLSLGLSTLPVSYTVKYPADKIDADKDPLADEMRALGDAYQKASALPTVIDLKAAHLGLVGEKAYIHRQLVSLLVQLSFFQSYHDVEIVLLLEEGWTSAMRTARPCIQEDRSKFNWTRWLPHCRNKNINMISLVSTENHRDQVLGNIAQVLKTRKQKKDEEKKDSKYLPHYIFIIDSPKLIINHSIMEYLQTPETSLGFSLIYTTHLQANLPENIKTVFTLDGGDKGTLLMNKGELKNQPVNLYNTSDIHTERVARTLAPIRHVQGVSTQIPESVTFFELYGVKRPDEIPVLELWNENACHKSLAVPLGLRGKDDIVMLNLHEKAHGPHGLVAGTTGSGKSEIVQSYILSLAVNFHPHEVGFLLIDYKGGGMANLFAKLPHLLGTITNLDGSESMRALASIKSELARRQRIFGEVGVNNINQYTKRFKARETTLPLPHLFIISDEFAELKKEQPDFMAELVSTARIGRSLGVHLILATQKPTGVVDDQIWSNSKFKLALKVADESDSNEILKTPDAARITQPGRSYLQVGNNEIYELFQSAYSGAAYSESVVKQGYDSRVYLINRLGQGELLNQDLSAVDGDADSKLTQLDVTVNHINELYSKMGATVDASASSSPQGERPAPVDRPWLPPLAKKTTSPHIAGASQDVFFEKSDPAQETSHNLASSLKASIGIADIPEQQAQVEYSHTFTEDGNLAFFGASGFGKSTSVMNVLLQLARQNSPGMANYFVLDYGNSALAQLRGLPHTADYLTIDDDEKLKKLIKLLTEELKKRKSLFAAVNATNFRMYNEVAAARHSGASGFGLDPKLDPESPALPAILLVIDNYDVVKEIDPELEEFLVKLTRDGVGVGVYTVITASRLNAVRYSVINNFKNKIAYFMFDASEVTAIVGRSAYKLPEVQGRALVKMADVHVMQCYLPVEYESDVEYAKNIGAVVAEIAEQNAGAKAAGVRMVPEVVTYEDLLPYVKPAEDKQAVIGFDMESTEPAYLDVSGGNRLIVGAAATGKTNILRIIAAQFAGHTIFVADTNAGDLRDLEDKANITYMENAEQFNDFYTALETEVDTRKAAHKESNLRLRDFMATQPPALVLIEDWDYFATSYSKRAMDMDDLVPAAMEYGICFIAATTPAKMRGYEGLTIKFKGAGLGIILGNPSEQALLQQAKPRNIKPVADIGYIFKSGEISQIKIPLIQEGCYNGRN